MMRVKKQNSHFGLILLLAALALLTGMQGGGTYAATTQSLKSNAIPSSVFQLISLRSLIVQGMDCDYGDQKTCWALTEIPHQIARLKQLRSLRLPVNNITAIPLELTQLPDLIELDLSDNPGLTDLTHLPELRQLEQLSLNGCNLTKMPFAIGNLRKLKKLGLAGNNFSWPEKVRIRKALPACSINF